MDVSFSKTRLRKISNIYNIILIFILKRVLLLQKKVITDKRFYCVCSIRPIFSFFLSIPLYPPLLLSNVLVISPAENARHCYLTNQNLPAPVKTPVSRSRSARSSCDRLMSKRLELSGPARPVKSLSRGTDGLSFWLVRPTSGTIYNHISNTCAVTNTWGWVI